MNTQIDEEALTPEQQAIFDKHIGKLRDQWNKYGWPSDASIAEAARLITLQIRQGVVS